MHLQRRHWHTAHISVLYLLLLACVAKLCSVGMMAEEETKAEMESDLGLVRDATQNYTWDRVLTDKEIQMTEFVVPEVEIF
jgi:hypothetical protein